MTSFFDRQDEPTRRDFLWSAARGLLGLGTIPLLGQAALAARSGGAPALGPATARNVIYLYMSGGMSHLDTFDPKPGAETQGPTESIATKADGVRIGAPFTQLAKVMDKVCVVRSLRSTQGAHAQGRYFLHTSYELRGTIRHPSLGAWLDRMAGPVNPTLPAHVAIGGGPYQASAGFFESRHVPLPIGDPEAGLENGKRHERVTQETFDERLSRVQQMNAEFAARYEHPKIDAYADMYEQAVRLMSSSDLEAFDVSLEPEATRDGYGRDSFGQGCLLARRLVERGVRFVEVVSGGWDTHDQNFEAMEELCPPLDRTLAALLSDLDARGLLDETLVVLATEFGRTPRIVTERMGRNHYPKAFAGLLAGGGVVGGRAWGATNETGEEIVEGELLVPDLNATIAHALGLPLDHVVYSPTGRPFTVAHKGRPCTQLFG